jgi:uncharacterized protein YbjT (DUF2867 family)
MNVLLLGATGRTGIYVLDYLLGSGYTVNALVRNKTKLKKHSAGLNVFEANTLDKAALLSAAKGCDAIVSVLNISRTSDFPWAKLRTEKDFLSVTMANILEIAKEININRVIVCSAWGVHETKKDIPDWFRWVINNSNVGIAYKDHERQEDLLKSSKLNYTIVRPVGLTNSVKEKEILISQNNIPKPNLTISRKNTAKFIVELLKDTFYSNQSVTISSK